MRTSKGLPFVKNSLVAVTLLRRGLRAGLCIQTPTRMFVDNLLFTVGISPSFTCLSILAWAWIMPCETSMMGSGTHARGSLAA